MPFQSCPTLSEPGEVPGFQRYMSLKWRAWTIIRRMIATLQTERLRTVD